MNKKKKSHFNRQEKAILRVLHKEMRPMSIDEIAKEAGLSWVTVKKWLKKLDERGYINFELRHPKLPQTNSKAFKLPNVGSSGRIRWGFNFTSIYGRGWWGESRRHSLAARKGRKTKKKMKKIFP